MSDDLISALFDDDEREIQRLALVAEVTRTCANRLALCVSPVNAVSGITIPGAWAVPCHHNCSFCEAYFAAKKALTEFNTASAMNAALAGDDDVPDFDSGEFELYPGQR